MEQSADLQDGLKTDLVCFPSSIIVEYRIFIYNETGRNLPIQNNERFNFELSKIKSFYLFIN